MQLPALCRNRLVCVLALTLVLAAAFALAWRHALVADVITPEAVVAWVDGMSEKWWTPLLILAAYTPAMIVMFPRPLITLAAVVAYGPYLGGLLAMTGIEIASTVAYFAGRGMKEETLHRWAGR